uniref:Zinc finger protein 79-like n=1 Tax=Phascolarctos cinereus TaxID=38626 RepID=A0A6P5J8M8_PHACI|nr:zinc finger protein 79-like [Phascolarctos cinereus]
MVAGSRRPPAQGSTLWSAPQVCELQESRGCFSIKGLPVPKEDLISYLEEKEAPWLLEQEGLKSCCPEREIRPEMKETTGKLSISVKQTHKENFMSDGSCNFSGRQICAVLHRIHTGEKCYNCHHYRKEPSKQASLIYHQKINTRKKPHECQECGEAFSERSTFIIHQRIHTGQKPYECDQRGKAFTQSSSLAAY